MGDVGQKEEGKKKKKRKNRKHKLQFWIVYSVKGQHVYVIMMGKSHCAADDIFFLLANAV